ncbi:MAG: amidohydrolase [Mycobacteriales bacterium]|jgi:amidohydrolase
MNRHASLDAFLQAAEPDLIDVRRQLHAHPELGRAEYATTALIGSRLEAAGLAPRTLPGGTGLICDVGDGDGPPVALRADLDALPLPDEKEVPYRSTVEGVSHACGHDVHTTALLGAGLALAEMARTGSLPGRVRLLFQPAEELTPGGALDVVNAGGLDGVRSIFALHCDPRAEVGRLGVRAGPITAAADQIEVVVTGAGGHTARPHLSADVVFALGEIVTRVPALLSRRVDPRAGLSLVWGQIAAGTAPNVIPQSGIARGTVRVLDHGVWTCAPDLLRELVEAVAAPTGVEVEISYRRGVPPVVNEEGCAALMARAAESALGPGSVVPTEQSLGGEDFAWYLETVPGALGRLGTCSPDFVVPGDLHRGTFDVDERAIGLGVRVFVATALAALAEPVTDAAESRTAPRRSLGAPVAR